MSHITYMMLYINNCIQYEIFTRPWKINIFSLGVIIYVSVIHHQELLSHNFEPGHDTVIEAYEVPTLVWINTLEKEQSH